MEAIKKIINKIKEIINKIKTNDKAMHLLVNLSIVIIFGLIFNPAIGLGLAIIASISKELYDEYRPEGSGWDWDDICADAIGILLGLFIIL